MSATNLLDANLVDPGQWVDAADRIAAGHWPYRDWTGIYGPGLYAAAAWACRALGSGWRATGLLLEVVSPVACLILAAIAGRAALPGTGWPLLFLALTGILGLDACYWSPGVRIWWPLAAVAVATRCAAGPARGWLGAAAACGLAPLVSPETGTAAVAAVFSLALFLRFSVGPVPVPVVATAAAVAIPAGLAFALAPAVAAGFAGAAREMAGAANWLWGIPLPGPLWPGRRLAFLAPPLVAFGCLALAGWRLARRRDPAARGRAAADLSLALFAALVQRAALGRADVAHLLFALPPVFLCWLRLWAGADAPFPTAAGLAVAGLVPYLVLGLAEGQPGRTLHALTVKRAGFTALVGEAVRAPAPLAGRLTRIAAAARPLAPPNRPILSLPGPIYARLLGRRNALPVATPELLGAMPDGGRAALAALDADLPAVVVLDRALALPWDDYYLQPAGTNAVDGPLGWSTPADEAATRELREWLASRYRPLRQIEGAWLLVPRTRPAPARRPRVVSRLIPTPEDLASLARGEIIRLAANGTSATGLRLTARCRYPLGTAFLAKTLIRLRAVDRTGRVREGVIPLPPAHLDREVRMPLAGAALERIELEIGGAGSLNPAPASVVIPAVELVVLD